MEFSSVEQPKSEQCLLLGRNLFAAWIGGVSAQRRDQLSSGWPGMPSPPATGGDYGEPDMHQGVVLIHHFHTVHCDCTPAVVIVQKGNEGLYNPDPEQLSRNAAVSNVSWWGWMTGPSRPGAVGDCASGDYTVFNQNETSVGKTI